jgi:hypothetical protein
LHKRGMNRCVRDRATFTAMLRQGCDLLGQYSRAPPCGPGWRFCCVELYARAKGCSHPWHDSERIL